MLRLTKNVTLIFAIAVFVAGCSSKNNVTGPNSSAPQLKAPQFHGPVSTSSSADTSLGARTAVSTAALFDGISAGFMAYYAGSGTQSGNSWTWSSTENGITGVWTATSASSGYSWKLVLNGSSGNTSYNNWTALTGSESSDGKSGNWTLYYLNSSEPEFAASWSTDSNGNLTGTILVYNTSGALTAKEIFTNNTDNSGELKIYTGATLTLDIKWIANGSGTWVEYDPTSGAEINSGSWS